MRIIIIGAGPGGYETALLAAKRGVEVVLVEAGHVGGTCLNEGCIPTKSFCRNAEVLDTLRESESFGITGLDFKFDFKHVTSRKNAVVEQLRGGVESLLGHKNITLVHGKASFKDSHTVIVGDEEYQGDYVIIATGSVSASLPVPGADLPGMMTSKEILDIEDYIDETIEYLGSAIDRNYEKWGYSFQSVYNGKLYDFIYPTERNVRNYEGAVEQLKDCLSNRIKFMNENIGRLGSLSHDSINKKYNYQNCREKGPKWVDECLFLRYYLFFCRNIYIMYF